jgi:serine/threonine protein kinase
MGVIHRDIKPDNVLFESGPKDRIALSDFGIATVLGAVQRSLTEAGGFSGSPGYLAPEIIHEESPTTLADVYSFGIVLYEVISGRGPFDNYDQRETLAFILAKIEKDAPDIRSFRSDVPAEIADRLSLALSRDRSLRPASARAALAGIESAVGRL